MLATQKPSGWLRWRRCSVTRSHGAVLASGDVLQTIVGEGLEAGRLLQQDGGVTKDQPVDGLWLLLEDGDGGRGGCRDAEVAP